MVPPDIICAHCGNKVQYWQSHCDKCSEFVGFPNVRRAKAEQTILEDRYEDACGNSAATATDHLLDDLEKLVADCVPVISMKIEVCDDILRNGKYYNYHDLVKIAARDPAEIIDHGDREMVGGRLFPYYGHNIHYAALAPDGHGLPNYGPVAVSWQVTPHYLERRCSLLERNSYLFFEEHKLGELGAETPKGHQAVWQDRAKLAAAKIEPQLTSSTPASAVPTLIMRPGADRRHDEFIEVIIYADNGITTDDVKTVKLLAHPTSDDERDRWGLIKGSCAARTPPVKVVE